MLLLLLTKQTIIMIVVSMVVQTMISKIHRTSHRMGVSSSHNQGQRHATGPKTDKQRRHAKSRRPRIKSRKTPKDVQPPPRQRRSQSLAVIEDSDDSNRSLPSDSQKLMDLPGDMLDEITSWHDRPTLAVLKQTDKTLNQDVKIQEQLDNEWDDLKLSGDFAHIFIPQNPTLARISCTMVIWVKAPSYYYDWSAECMDSLFPMDRSWQDLSPRERQRENDKRDYFMVLHVQAVTTSIGDDSIIDQYDLSSFDNLTSLFETAHLNGQQEEQLFTQHVETVYDYREALSLAKERLHSFFEATFALDSVFVHNKEKE